VVLVLLLNGVVVVIRVAEQEGCEQKEQTDRQTTSAVPINN
jgi:hypothetical protein